MGNAWCKTIERQGKVDIPDFSKLRGCADERHWNEFVVREGGELVGPLIHKQGVENADYLFRAEGVVIELKILETQFLRQATMQKRVAAAFRKHPGIDPGDRSKALNRELLNIFRAPLQRIFKKANNQIKSTADTLGLGGVCGILVCVNDGFRDSPPGLVIDLLREILYGPHYRSVSAVIYQTNHYVELEDSPFAHLLWIPSYAEYAPDELVNFIDELGRSWRKYSEEVDGPYDVSVERPTSGLDLRQIRVVRGPKRQTQYFDPD